MFTDLLNDVWVMFGWCLDEDEDEDDYDDDDDDDIYNSGWLFWCLRTLDAVWMMMTYDDVFLFFLTNPSHLQDQLPANSSQGAEPGDATDGTAMISWSDGGFSSSSQIAKMICGKSNHETPTGPNIFKLR